MTLPPRWTGRGWSSAQDLDELYRARAEKAGITYVDVWDGFVDDHGNYAQQGPDFQGQTRRLRTYDGVNFTNYGADKLAHYVEHELRRVLTNHVLPVALPVPEEQSPANGAAVVRRPSARSFLSVRSAAARAATSWVPQASPRNRKPIRLRRGCSIAATRSSRRLVAPTISPGRVPIPAPAALWTGDQPPMTRRPRFPPARTIQKTEIRTARTSPRQ